MKRDTVNYFVVGIFVLALFATFMVVVYRITGNTGATDEYFTVYDNVTGIQYGTPVLFEGYQIGQVEEVTPQLDNGNASFRLTLSVIKDWVIQKDSLAKIEASGLLSAVTIDIKQGQSKDLLSPGDTIQGKDAENIFAAVNDIAADFKDLTRNTIRPFLDNLNEQVDLISTDIKSITGDQIKPLLADQVSPFMDKLNLNADNLYDLLSDDNIQSVKQMLENLEAASAEANVLMANVEESRKALDGILLKIDEVVDENREGVRQSVQDMQRSLYVVSQHIDAIAHHIEGSSRNIQEFTRQIRENPTILLRSSAPQEVEGVQ